MGLTDQLHVRRRRCYLPIGVTHDRPHGDVFPPPQREPRGRGFCSVGCVCLEGTGGFISSVAGRGGGGLGPESATAPVRAHMCMMRTGDHAGCGLVLVLIYQRWYLKNCLMSDRPLAQGWAISEHPVFGT